jgi:carbamoyltransferase
MKIKEELMIDAATFLVNDSDVPALCNILSNLASNGYCEKHVCERLGLSDITELLWRALPIYREERLAARDALDLAIDFFLLQGVISTHELNQLFNTCDQEVLVRVGLLLIKEKKCFARASLFPVGESLIFSDHAWPKLPHPGYVDVPYDQVMYVGKDSHWLARTTVRSAIGSTLDLCSGSGIHALLAAKHSQKVVAVDINPRAAQCIRFNAQAAGAANIEIVTGDLFEPVHGECFDLITANPPFVPSPVDSIRYRDGGHSGEEVLRRIVTGLPNHLAPGGVAQIITELGEREDEPLDHRLRIWLDGASIDILILCISVHSATSFAIGHADSDDNYDSFLSSVHSWFSNLKAQGYTRIISVLLTFKWSDPTLGSPWTRIEESQPPHSDAGNEIEAMFLAEHIAHQSNLYEMLELNRMYRAGPIGMMESRVLGSELHPNIQVKLLGKAFSSLKMIDLVEREVLVLMEKPMTFSELLKLTKEQDLCEEAVFTAVTSLLRIGYLLLVRSTTS